MGCQTVRIETFLLQMLLENLIVHTEVYLSPEAVEAQRKELAHKWIFKLKMFQAVTLSEFLSPESTAPVRRAGVCQAADRLL